MTEVQLLRTSRSSNGTEGKVIAGGYSCYSFELPWKDNQKSISCIPIGEYQAMIRISGKYGRVYWLSNVPDRSLILIHSGNFAGDAETGLKTHTMGCILLGTNVGFLGNQRAILNSRVAIRMFMEHLNYEPFVLNVMEGFGG